jgi:hypothetical protein
MASSRPRRPTNVGEDTEWLARMQEGLIDIVKQVEEIGRLLAELFAQYGINVRPRPELTAIAGESQGSSKAPRRRTKLKSV